MSEDYTYPTTPTLADLRTRVAELERQLAQDDTNMVELAERNAELLSAAVQNAQDMLTLRVECDGLRARLDAVPWATLRCTIQVAQDNNPYYGHITDAAMYWLEHNEPKPDADDDDAPLTLADIDDEDGDTRPRVPNWAKAPEWAQWHAIEADGRGWWFPYSPLPAPWGGAFWYIPGLGEHDAQYDIEGVDFTTPLTARPQVVQP